VTRKPQSKPLPQQEDQAPSSPAQLLLPGQQRQPGPEPSLARRNLRHGHPRLLDRTDKLTGKTVQQRRTHRPGPGQPDMVARRAGHHALRAAHVDSL
jgi:hypothetical protein